MEGIESTTCMIVPPKGTVFGSEIVTNVRDNSNFRL